LHERETDVASGDLATQADIVVRCDGERVEI
jgi:hypothetical protein